MQAFTVEGKTYAYPTLFQMPVFIADAKEPYAGGINSLSELVKVAGEKGALHYGNYQEMFESLYLPYSNTIFPNAASVNEAALKDFLQNTKTISDELKLTSEIEYVYGGVGNADIMPWQGINAMIEDSVKYAADILWEPTEMSSVFLFKERTITTLPGQGFIPVCAASVPVGSKNQDAAIDFINIMLQDNETQETRMEQGFSVIVDKHEAIYKKAGDNVVGKPAEFNWDGLISEFSGPAVTEKILQEKLYEQAEQVYQNKITVEEATANIMKSTKIYFEEREQNVIKNKPYKTVVL